jgi:chromosomal replication initiator protein
MSEETVLSLWRGRIPIRRTMARILDEVSEESGISVADLKSPARFRFIAWPRQYAMWRMVNEGLWSLPQIGRFFNRDHTTVIWAFRQVEKRNALEQAA